VWARDEVLLLFRPQSDMSAPVAVVPPFQPSLPTAGRTIGTERAERPPARGATRRIGHEDRGGVRRIHRAPPCSGNAPG
jgi:hypothetical protein